MFGKKNPVNRNITPKEIAAGYGFAGIVLCLGIYFSLKAGDEGGGALLRIFDLLAALIVLNFTFAWGRLRGFPARRKDGSIAAGHILRNLVMSVIMGMGVLVFFTPIIMFVFRLAR